MCITATMNKLRHRVYKCNDVLFTFYRSWDYFRWYVELHKLKCHRPVYGRNVYGKNACIWAFDNCIANQDALSSCIINNGNAKRGVSPRLQIRPCDLDLWPWKSIGLQIHLRSKYVPSLVNIHWRMLILECSRKSVLIGNTVICICIVFVFG
jgi:hypothetical protein